MKRDGGANGEDGDLEQHCDASSDSKEKNKLRKVRERSPDSKEQGGIKRSKAAPPARNGYICRYDYNNGLPLLYPEFLTLLGDPTLQNEYDHYHVSLLDRLKDYNGGGIPCENAASVCNSKSFEVPPFVQAKFQQESFPWRFAFLSVLSTKLLISLDTLKYFVKGILKSDVVSLPHNDTWTWIEDVRVPSGPLRYSVKLMSTGSNVFAKLKVKSLNISVAHDSRLSRKFPDSLLHVKFVQCLPHCSSRLSQRRGTGGSVAVHQYMSDVSAKGLTKWLSSIFEPNIDRLSMKGQVELCRSFGAESLYTHANPENPLYGFRNIIEYGLYLCGKEYFPIAVSAGQGCSYRMTMANFDDSIVNPIIFGLSWNTWDKLSASQGHELQKTLVRMSLLKTPSIPCGEVKAGLISDCWSNASENRKTLPFSDGCGMISHSYLERCWGQYCDKMDVRTRSHMMGYGAEQLQLIHRQNVPSAIQIRFAGVKGMLVCCSDDELMRGFDILIRKESMIKIRPPRDTPEHEALEIVNFSCPSQNATLNIELISVLCKSGVPLDFFKTTCETNWKELLASNNVRKEQLKNGDLAGFNLGMFGFPQRVSSLGLFISVCMPLRFSLPDSGLYFGVADFTGTLKPGEVYLCPSRKGKQIMADTLVIMKDPCLKKSDVMRVKLVKDTDPRISRLKDLKDVIVFACPQHVDSHSKVVPDPFRVAGSDLDGDQFICIWNKEILKNCTEVSNSESFFQATTETKEAYSEEPKVADSVWEEKVEDGVFMRKYYIKLHGIQPWDEHRVSSAKKFEDSHKKKIHDVIVSAGTQILSPLMGAVSYIPFNELRSIRMNYLLNWLESDGVDASLFDAAEALGQAATSAVDAIKSGEWLKAENLTTKAREAILNEPHGFTFDSSICRNVNFTKGFLTDLILTGARILNIAPPDDISTLKLSFADEMHLQSAVCRILSLKNRNNDKDILKFPVLPDENISDDRPLFRRLAQFSLFWKLYLARSICDDDEVKVIVSLCPVQSLPPEDMELLAGQRKVYLTRKWHAGAQNLEGCQSGLLQSYTLPKTQFQKVLHEEFLESFGIRNFEGSQLDVPDPYEYAEVHRTCEDYKPLSRIPRCYWK